MTVTELYNRLDKIRQTFPNAPVRMQGWSDTGDLTDVAVHGDIRLERDAVGNPVIVIR